MDVHFDDVWSSFLLNLLTMPEFPENPYSMLVRELRKAAMKLDSREIIVAHHV